MTQNQVSTLPAQSGPEGTKPLSTYLFRNAKVRLFALLALPMTWLIGLYIGSLSLLLVTAFWFVENWRHMRYWDQIAPAYDAFFHIQPGEFEAKLDAIGCAHHAFVQTGCDPALHRPVTLEQKVCGFVLIRP